MNKPCVLFLYEDTFAKNYVVEFLASFYEVFTKSALFSLDSIKTKDLYFHLDQNLQEFPADFVIIQSRDRFEVFDEMKRRIAIDFDNDKINYHRKIFAKDPFLRAIGKNNHRVLDISAGLGIDAVFLAQNGHQVVAVERNPLLFLLLSRALECSQRFLKKQLAFEFADGAQYINKHLESLPYDCVYFDPMFPDKTKTALPKQEMVLFRQLVGADQDSESVLMAALKARIRVVVKRPLSAPPIVAKPNNSFESKLIRFDIYEGK